MDRDQTSCTFPAVEPRFELNLNSVPGQVCPLLAVWLVQVSGGLGCLDWTIGMTLPPRVV